MQRISARVQWFLSQTRCLWNDIRFICFAGIILFSRCKWILIIRRPNPKVPGWNRGGAARVIDMF